MKSTTPIFIIALFFLTSFEGHAQAESEYCTITLKDGKKRTGYIRKEINSKFAEGVEFSRSEGAPGTIIRPSDALLIEFNSGSRFVPLTFIDPLDSNKQKTLFCKYLVKGKFDLYGVPVYQSLNFLVKEPNDSLVYLYKNQVRPGGEVLKMGNYQFELESLASGCDALRNKSVKVNFSEKEMVDFVAQANRCAGKEPELFYIKPKKEVKFFAQAGGMYFGNERKEFFGQVFARFKNPETSRKVSLNAGLAYAWNAGVDKFETPSGSVEINELITYISLPLTIQYNFTESKIQPFINAGISLLYQQTQDNYPGNTVNNTTTSSIRPAFVAEIGIEAFLSEHLMIKGQWRYEYFVHYPLLSIGYRF